MAIHLTVEEREIIAHMRRAGKMQTQIAERLGRSKSTISRELRRNRSRNGYRAFAANAEGRAAAERTTVGGQDVPAAGGGDSFAIRVPQAEEAVQAIHRIGTFTLWPRS